MTHSNGPRRTIVLIHGAFITRRSWESWISRYQDQGHDCIAIAYPGREKPVSVLKNEIDDPILSALRLQDVIDHIVAVIEALPEKPIIIGHSFGGLLTQLMLQRELATAGVAISSVPPQGVVSFRWSFIRSLWPIVNPVIPASKPYYMTFDQFKYTFSHDLTAAEQRAGYDADIVPESRRFARGGLSKVARVDFDRKTVPLLMIAAEYDHIMPASLNRSNWRRYRKSPSTSDFKVFPNRAHYSIIAGSGWEEVADYALDWAIEQSVSDRAADKGVGVR